VAKKSGGLASAPFLPGRFELASHTADQHHRRVSRGRGTDSTREEDGGGRSSG
jgi:hypothetical protein